MISKETTNSIGYQATDASSKSSTVSRPTSRNITAEADPSNKNKSHISGTQVSRYTASSRPSEPTIPPFQKSSKSEQHSQKMSSNRIHGYQRSHSHRTNSVTSGGSKQTRSNPKKKVETNHDSTLNPVRSHTKDTSVTSPTKRKSRRRRNQAKSKSSSSEVRHDHDQSIPTISEDHVLSHTSIKSSQRKSRTLPSPRTSETTTTTTTKNIDENEHVVKKLPMTSFQAGKAHDTRNALYFSQSISLLNNYDCGLKMEMKHIHATINNEGFQNLVRKAFNRLVEVRPRLIYLLSPEEWLHIHILILYARIFDCELHFHRIVLPPEFQIKIPENIQIFEPIVAILSSIGIVDDIDMGVTYIPVAKPYRGDADVHYKPHDKDDVTEFLEWAQYDWLKSWDQVKKGRLERKRMAAENNIKIPQNDGIAQGQCDDDDVMKLTEWEQLALEKWLGWDDELWPSYKQACYVLSRIANFVTMPIKDSLKSGSYAWLLPRRQLDDSIKTIVRVPKPNISPDSWMIAMMLDMSALQPKTTESWYYETNAIDNVPYITDQFIRSAIKSPTRDVATP